MWRIPFLLLALIYAFDGAYAADMPVKAPFVAATPSCTVTQCSGFYVGASLAGLGTNADILGSGLNGSVFGDGGGVGIQGGYQLWNGNFFAAAEIAATYYVPTRGATGNVGQQFQGLELIKVGYGLQNLFNAGTPGASQGPVAIFSTLQANLISPYVVFGASNRSFGTGWVTGAGAEYTLGNGYNAFAEYLRAQYNMTVNGVVVNDDNIIRIGVNRKF